MGVKKTENKNKIIGGHTIAKEREAPISAGYNPILFLSARANRTLRPTVVHGPPRREAGEPKPRPSVQRGHALVGNVELGGVMLEAALSALLPEHRSGGRFYL